MGPATHFLTYPLQGWRLDREDLTVRLVNPKGETVQLKEFENETAARRGLWDMRNAVYAAEEGNACP